MPTSAAVRKAVIPAAGMGTRFLPATKAVPKEMLPVVDTPTIQYVVEEAVAAGLGDILDTNTHVSLHGMLTPHVKWALAGLALLAAMPIALKYFRRRGR